MLSLEACQGAKQAYFGKRHKQTIFWWLVFVWYLLHHKQDICYDKAVTHFQTL